MELDRKEGIFYMLYALITPIIGINKPGSKIWREHPNGKAMILCGDIATLRPILDTRLILASMPIFQFIRIATRCKREQLMPKANAKDGNATLQSSLNSTNRFVCHFGIARTIGYHNTIKGEIKAWGKEIKIPWDGNYAHVSCKQAAHNVAFSATVNQGNSRISTSFTQNLPGRNLGNQV